MNTTTYYTVKSAAHDSYLWRADPYDNNSLSGDFSWEHVSDATMFDCPIEAQHWADKKNGIIGTVDVSITDWKPIQMIKID